MKLEEQMTEQAQRDLHELERRRELLFNHLTFSGPPPTIQSIPAEAIANEEPAADLETNNEIEENNTN